MKRARAIDLTDEERTVLGRWSRGQRTPARLVLRATIVLLAAEGRMNKDIAAELKTAPKTVSLWRRRFADGRLAGLEKDAPRGGRHPSKRQRLARRIIETNPQQKPANATHWSTRSLAKHLGCSASTVQRLWKASGLKPHLVRTFKVSNAPTVRGKADRRGGPVRQSAGACPGAVCR